MICPPLSKLTDKIESRYSMVIASAKRAREISEGAEVLVECDSKKPVTIAIEEIAEGKVQVLEK
ncbi:MAG: DNA-directed RNA polymerase subunit omega [Clostridia bacterium]|nr:DNA-directed RNA polymerase subunit omega [Clostridia bacterium]